MPLEPPLSVVPEMLRVALLALLFLLPLRALLWPLLLEPQRREPLELAPLRLMGVMPLLLCLVLLQPAAKLVFLYTQRLLQLVLRLLVPLELAQQGSRLSLQLVPLQMRLMLLEPLQLVLEPRWSLESL